MPTKSILAIAVSVALGVIPAAAIAGSKADNAAARLSLGGAKSMDAVRLGAAKKRQNGVTPTVLVGGLLIAGGTAAVAFSNNNSSP